MKLAVSKTLDSSEKTWWLNKFCQLSSNFIAVYHRLRRQTQALTHESCRYRGEEEFLTSDRNTMLQILHLTNQVLQLKYEKLLNIHQTNTLNSQWWYLNSLKNIFYWAYSPNPKVNPIWHEGGLQEPPPEKSLKCLFLML